MNESVLRADFTVGATFVSPAQDGLNKRMYFGEFAIGYHLP